MAIDDCCRNVEAELDDAFTSLSSQVRGAYRSQVYWMNVGLVVAMNREVCHTAGDTRALWADSGWRAAAEAVNENLTILNTVGSRFGLEPVPLLPTTDYSSFRQFIDRVRL